MVSVCGNSAVLVASVASAASLVVGDCSQRYLGRTHAVIIDAKTPDRRELIAIQTEGDIGSQATSNSPLLGYG